MDLRQSQLEFLMGQTRATRGRGNSGVFGQGPARGQVCSMEGRDAGPTSTQRYEWEARCLGLGSEGKVKSGDIHLGVVTT